RGYEATFLAFGLMQGITVFVLAWLLRAPPELAETKSEPIASGDPRKRDYTPGEMLRTPVFWVMYAMFMLMAIGGLMATAQLGPIASDFRIADVPVSLLGLTLPALTFALSIDRVL